MEIPTGVDIDELLVPRDAPCVSLFMPAHRKGAETQQDRPRLKNLLDWAEERLLALGLRTPDAHALLQPGRERLDEGVFWRHQGDGLAMYLAPGWSRDFRLPYALRELVVVGGRCHLRPLLEGLWPDQPFHLLALSLSGVRLFEGSRHRLEARELPGAPKGIEDTQRFLVVEKQLHAKVGPRRDVSRAAIYHGHGAGREDERERVVEYLREVDRAVVGAVGRSGLPLVLAGVEHVLAVYRGLTSHGHVLDGAVDGSPDDLPEDRLHAAAWPLVESVVVGRREAALERYAQGAARGAAVTGLDEVLRAAAQARLDTLFVAEGEHRWGWFLADTGEVRLHDGPQPGDEDLLDRAVVDTYRTGGTFYSLPLDEMPAGRPIAGLSRY